MTNRGPRFMMEVDLNVLEHLGLNLYSNVPAVLSEIVANSWDADAERVSVELNRDQGKIIIQDDGFGMTGVEVNKRFLRVGYRRRDRQPGLTRKGRAPMGRKGIGKLSLFSIADSIVVETVRDSQKSALRMVLNDIKAAIERGENRYSPKELPTHTIDFEHGTRITLHGLRKRQTISTQEGLKKRLARRFSIIGPSYDFLISVNGSEITPADRGYYNRLQYIWTYGDQKPIVQLCNKLVHEEHRSNTLHVSNVKTLTVEGWLGTVQESKNLRDEHGENLNRIAIFVRGKMAQEDLLSEFAERGVYASYLIGELRVDGLDVDNDEDAATSSRQRIVEDDERYVALKKFMATELKHIQNEWSNLRIKAGAKKALEIPAVKEWIEILPGEYRRRAQNWLGKIHRINVDDPKERPHLIKHAVLAFEFYRWNENLERLETIGDENLESAIDMFRDLDGLEASLYGQIVKQRIKVIQVLQEKVDRNDKERAIQSYIFDHLWLLDPSWERVEASELMEIRVAKLFENVDAKLSDEEKASRLDIQYRKTAGRHVIIELKRPERTVTLPELTRQIGKYRSGMLKILETVGASNESVEFVCLLGKPPSEWDEPQGKDLVKNVLDDYNARFVLYDELLNNAFEAYRDYTQKGKQVSRLDRIIKAIEDFEE